MQLVSVLGEDGNVEGELGVGLFLRLCVRAVFAQHCLLGVHAEPAIVRPLKDMREGRLFRSQDCVRALVVQRIGAVHHGHVAQHPHGDDLHRDRERLVVGVDELRDLLVPHRHVARGGDADKER